MKVAVIAVACLLQILSSGVVHGANPNYSYHVKIDDPAYVNFQEKAETRKGEDAQGFYSVLEPNGALRHVSYTADERGFNPIVSYTYGHAQSAVSVHSAAGPAALVKQPGVYAPAFVSDKRVQIVDKSNIYAAPPPALNFQAFSLPGPSAPVVVPAPLRVAVPVVKASAAIATNYAPAFVPPPTAYLPPPQQVVGQPKSQVIVRQPEVFAIPQPQRVAVYQQPSAFAVTKVIQPNKVLTAPAVKVVKAPTVTTVVKDSYSEPPKNTFRDPMMQSYPESVPRISYGPPRYLPPPPISEPTPVKILQEVVAPPVQEVKEVTAPKVAIAPTINVYAGAIGFHNVQANADSYAHAYGTQGFQVTSSRKFNKAIFTAPKYAVAQKVVQPVYGPPPTLVQPQVYGPPGPAKIVQPAPVYGPPPTVAFAPQKIVQAAPLIQQVALPAPRPVVQSYAPAQVALPQPAPLAVASPVAQVPAIPVPQSLTGGKQHPLVFSYGYDQGNSKAFHSYSGSGW